MTDPNRPLPYADDVETMPIEDASVEWPERESPYRTVAHLLLPRQKIALLRQQDAYQNLSFNVWHALAAHRPWEVSTASAAGPTPSRAPGGVSNLVRTWQSR